MKLSTINKRRKRILEKQSANWSKNEIQYALDILCTGHSKRKVKLKYKTGQSQKDRERKRKLHLAKIRRTMNESI